MALKYGRYQSVRLMDFFKAGTQFFIILCIVFASAQIDFVDDTRSLEWAERKLFTMGFQSYTPTSYNLPVGLRTTPSGQVVPGIRSRHGGLPPPVGSSQNQRSWPGYYFYPEYTSNPRFPYWAGPGNY